MRDTMGMGISKDFLQHWDEVSLSLWLTNVSYGSDRDGLIPEHAL